MANGRQELHGGAKNEPVPAWHALEVGDGLTRLSLDCPERAASGRFSGNGPGVRMSPRARTVAVNTLVGIEITYQFNSRSLTGAMFGWRALTANRFALGAAAAIILLQCAFTYTLPMQSFFGTVSMLQESWIFVGLSAGAAFPLVELEKAVRREGR